jgi:hypothetical protein
MGVFNIHKFNSLVIFHFKLHQHLISLIITLMDLKTNPRQLCLSPSM